MRINVISSVCHRHVTQAEIRPRYLQTGTDLSPSNLASQLHLSPCSHVVSYLLASSLGTGDSEESGATG